MWHFKNRYGVHNEFWKSKAFFKDRMNSKSLARRMKLYELLSKVVSNRILVKLFYVVYQLYATYDLYQLFLVKGVNEPKPEQFKVIKRARQS